MKRMCVNFVQIFMNFVNSYMHYVHGECYIPLVPMMFFAVPSFLHHLFFAPLRTAIGGTKRGGIPWRGLRLRCTM
jgi:hypothetical protein